MPVKTTCETSVNLLLSPWETLPCTNLLLNEPLKRNKHHTKLCCCTLVFVFEMNCTTYFALKAWAI